MDEYRGYNNSDNSWNYTPSSNPDEYTYSYYRKYEDGDDYEDLKTSSFYSESYKEPSKGKFKGIIVPMIIVALISSILTG